MLETLQTWIAAAGTFFGQYPAVSSIFIAISLSWAPGLVWDNWFAPESWTARHIKQYSLTMTFIVAAVVGSVCWRALVPTDGKAMVYVVSGASAFIAPFAHMVLGSVLDKYVPWCNLDGKLKKAA
jgi:hypothetical protein